MLDFLLAAYLILFVPAKALWRSWHKPAPRPERSRLRAAWSMTGYLALLLAWLALASWQGGRPAAALGLAWPLSSASLALLGAAVLLLAALFGGTWWWERRLDGAHREAYLAVRARAAERFAAHSRQEYLAQAVLFVVLGFAWEVLYRGFLLLVLTPHIGIVGAVTLSALAYGLAHGYDNPRQCISSIVAALVFTAAYALSGSLWWLILIHVALPLSGLLASRRSPVPVTQGDRADEVIDA